MYAVDQNQSGGLLSGGMHRMGLGIIKILRCMCYGVHRPQGCLIIVDW